jgi:hypothetical protein
MKTHDVIAAASEFWRFHWVMESVKRSWINRIAISAAIGFDPSLIDSCEKLLSPSGSSIARIATAIIRKRVVNRPYVASLESAIH